MQRLQSEVKELKKKLRILDLYNHNLQIKLEQLETENERLRTKNQELRKNEKKFQILFDNLKNENDLLQKVMYRFLA